ncbi:hypothetical protein G7Z17_g9255 [Cylindrodendrum hubeiense]|uniref:SnoaL-like domain-containing protein n=1 Tax=Cylindrodendrum hubeiense TaxID=595255 RepID=A0A9P5H1X6_9HYPO|nr:hypothetical protein G7Z17_g9255 [Cylindrodendrum hubeiense]
MSSPFSLPATLNPPLNGREAVADTMYRCAMAFDTCDADLFDSTFMEDGVFDVNGRAMKGLPEIHATGLTIIFKVDTTHMVTNMRVNMKPRKSAAGAVEEPNEASLTATVLSQHYAYGKGMEPSQKSLMSGSLYRGELAKDTDGLWKFTHLGAKSTWAEGDWGVIGGSFNDVEE